MQVEVERRYSQCNVGHWTLAAFERQNSTTLPPLPLPPGVLLSPQVVPIGAFMALTGPLGQPGWPPLAGGEGGITWVNPGMYGPQVAQYKPDALSK